jgi:hypothetical protein
MREAFVDVSMGSAYLSQSVSGMCWLEILLLYKWAFTERGTGYAKETCEGLAILQNPESRPTANRLESLLKATERAGCSLGDSMGGRVFIAAVCGSQYSQLGEGGERREAGRDVTSADAGHQRRRSKAELPWKDCLC